MPISVTNPANGAVMSWPSSTFATMRTWLNAVPDSDLTDNSIQREHLVRPVVAPGRGQFSQYADRAYFTGRLEGSPMYDKLSWAHPGRIDIIGHGMDRHDQDRVWTTPIGVQLTGQFTHIRAWFSAGLFARIDPDLFAPAGSLPNQITDIVQVQARGFDLATKLEYTATAGEAVAHSPETWSSDRVEDPAVGVPPNGTLYQWVAFTARFDNVALDRVYVSLENLIGSGANANIEQLALDRVMFYVEAF